MTYRPVYAGPDGDLAGAAERLAALRAFPEATVSSRGTNADTHGRAIIRRLTHYANANARRVRLFDSLGSLHYSS